MPDIRRNVLVPLADGGELAADVMLPPDASPVPVLLGVTPYHKDGASGAGWMPPSEYFAQHGYGSVHADIRGLGGSRGPVRAAFDAGDARDAAELIAWIAAQPWCDGTVGMWGISYGGFAALATAALNPPALKAAIPIVPATDAYDHLLYPGGCPNALNGEVLWGTQMLGLQLVPPLYRDPAGRWREVWRERLEQHEPWLLPWMRHPDREDPCWRDLAVPYEQVRVPTFLIGGWRDMFADGVPEVYGRLAGPKKLLMGPWMHGTPDAADDEPLDQLHEMRRWWDRWLKGVDDGIGDEPPVSAYVQGAARWRHEAAWPPEGVAPVAWWPAVGGRALREPDAAASTVAYDVDPAVGTTSGTAEPTSSAFAGPLDQNPDDARALAFTSEPLEADVELIGSPRAHVRLAISGAPEAHLVVKLCDVAPDGGSRLITTGWLRIGDAPADERAYDVHLWATSYLVPTGHRLRIAIAGADFPRIWPARGHGRFEVALGAEGTHVVLPTIARPGLDGPRHRVAPVGGRGDLVAQREIRQDVARGTTTVVLAQEREFATPAGQARVRFSQRASQTVATAHPGASHATARTALAIEHEDGSTTVTEAATRLTRWGGDLSASVVVDGQLVFERSWRQPGPPELP